MATHLEEYLGYYLTLKAPGYAVLVTGEWGVGKTFQVKQCIPEEKMLYVSLFGVQTVDQLHAEVFAASAPKTDKIGKIIQETSNVIASMQGPWALAGGTPSIFNAIFKRNLKPNKTIVFDDLERSDIELKNLLGGINNYVEQLGFRVIVIAHDRKITEKFGEMKEKIFGQTIHAQPNIDMALEKFISQIDNAVERKFVDCHKCSIRNVFLSSGVKSLRVLRHIVEDVVRLFGALTQNQRAHSAAMDELVQSFSAFAAEVRSANLSKDDLCNRQGSSVSFMMSSRNKSGDELRKPPIVEADEKYSSIDLEGGILSDEVLISMLIEGSYQKEEIRNSIDNSHYFMKLSEVPAWKVIYNFDELADDVVEDAINKIENQFKNREITVPGEILHMCCLRLRMAEIGVIKSNSKKIEADCKVYIDDLLIRSSMPPRDVDWRWQEEFYESYGGFIYWVSDEGREAFNRVRKHLILAQEKAFRKELPKILGGLVKLIKEDGKAFFEAVSPTNNGPNPYSRIPLLHGVPPREFVDAWLGSAHENWRYIKYSLEGRYDANLLDNDLESEKKWALEVLEELNRRAEAEEGLKALRISRIKPRNLVAIAAANSKT
ncbi:P-loop NTPase fold protein [Nisaea sp.]|uniref:P-loop NTPase fold protein n=1 Tax=Nisaea sp. TaxID=2024842 RepID=UPI002B277AEE|nr:P-loop NTPase fold protein [Nisaea sp.]